MPRHEPPIEEEFGEWWACEQPERPNDDLMCIDIDHCPACKIKALAVLAIEGDDGKLWYDMAADSEEDENPMTLTQLVAVFAD